MNPSNVVLSYARDDMKRYVYSRMRVRLSAVRFCGFGRRRPCVVQLARDVLAFESGRVGAVSGFFVNLMPYSAAPP